MQYLPAIWLATMAAIASTTLVVFGDEIIINSNANNEGYASSPTNNNIPSGHNMPKPSATQYHAQKSQRMAERRARVREKLANLPNEPNSHLHRMSDEELEQAYLAAEESAKKRGYKKDVKGGFIRKAKEDLKKHGDELEERRKLWGSSSWATQDDPYAATGGMADTTQYYDKWQQAYRFLGGYIDCNHSWGEGSGDGGGSGEGGGGCSRWMLWAAYIDPDYAGGEYGEYFGDNAEGSLDCHSPDSNWKLIGVYRQEFYQYIEQISKHLWAITEYEYVVALAGLDYMSDDQCRGIGYDEKGNALYAEVQPTPGGQFQMSLYSDAQCLTLNTQTSYTYDDFAEKGDMDLGSKDEGGNDDDRYQAYQYWQDTQEATLTNLNTVYNDFRYCTSCVDYPTYQDGYFIGDDGTDDDDLINQCWKFYSHDSFNVGADELAMATAQGSITHIKYNGQSFGQMMDGQYSTSYEGATLTDGGIVAGSSNGAQRMERLKANLFLTFAGIVFVATFLAFAVARGSSKKKKKKSRSRSRRLLDADYGGDRRSSSRSQSRRRTSDGKSVRSSRSKSKSRSASGKSVKSSSRSKSRSRRTGEYEPPSSSEKKSSSRSQSRSRKSSSSGRARRSEE